MKAWLLYIRLTNTVFLDSLKFQVNQENIYATLTILYFDLAEGDSKNLTIKSECQEQENEIKRTNTN